MSEILRRMKLRGDGLETSVPIHYGLVNWMLGLEPMLKPNTRFMGPYLAAVGALEVLARDIDLEIAVATLLGQQPSDSAKQALQAQETLLLRPLARLFGDAHALAGFLGRFDGQLWQCSGDAVEFVQSPIVFLRELYHFLDMETVENKPAIEMIWAQDDELLQDALAFYSRAAEAAGEADWQKLSARLEGPRDEAIVGSDDALWEACQASHRGFLLAAPLLLMIPRIGIQAGFLEIRVNDALEPVFPTRFTDEQQAAQLTRALAPPPKASANQIVSPTGGSFFAREAPHLPLLIDEGEHFQVGQPLFIIEVMKMFNKVLAPFAGTVKKNLMADSDNSVIKAGQVIFEIEPDEVLIEESVEEISARRKATTLAAFGA
jgi:biotin carboxyl carrier protein